MKNEEITFEKLPKAVAYLIDEVKQLKELLESEKETIPHKRKPIGIAQACQLIMRSKSAIYNYVSKGTIPCYKIGRRLYFYEDELIDWIEKGKRKTHLEVMDEICNEAGVRKSHFKRL